MILTSHPLQFGYKKGTGCQDAVFAVHHHHHLIYISQRGPSRRSSIMTASKGLSPEVGRCLAGVASDLVDPSATWATGPTTPGGMGKTTE